MNKSLKIGLIIVCFILLALIRMFQSELFNDPFIDFYKENYLQKQPPEIQQFSLYLNTAFRYFLNTIISLFAIYIAFPKKSVIKFSVFFYTVAFVLLMLMKIVVVNQLQPELYSLLFYIRRFLIQPIFVIVLLPAFYYQHKIQKQKA
ncbi:exosortase F system-associated membrane protein [Psychroflexus salis]|uniref:exosortase F system-associated membrane protein n=1 Tax=Psychroflexus salis TaxID=1526574 RepID=UPI001668E87A|nr:exosortase F system-associated protein [Psychroflexus salis]